LSPTPRCSSRLCVRKYKREEGNVFNDLRILRLLLSIASHAT
jgi:hypothetical protein